MKTIDCILFNAVFNNTSVISRRPVTYSCFPGAFLTSTPHEYFPSHWLLSHATIVETTDSVERGMNPVKAVTVINPRREYWPSRGSTQRPPVFRSTALPTELWGSD